ncbi:glycoside hydrolase family 3 N-terminal domain-containing protein [Flammeovirga aprica]|uniref:beta-glucosidase n=1 Tax=Flammeovirga aprica JL-4 TaxID=694437 RepID=A0A7X9RTW3_9BACT|nr:glycoside hydrolase family 3 N-terminal domain-containing protein [Flammeovirga aprica]NME68119.1 beta-glucosidase [Flammeovirga aprica JL-4]
MVKKLTIPFLGIVFFCYFWSANSTNARDENKEESIAEIINSTISVEKKADQILQKLTLEEKVGQMTQITLDVITRNENTDVSDEPAVLNQKKVREAIAKYKIGAVLNTAKNKARPKKEWNDIITQIQEEAIQEIGIPVLFGTDVQHGSIYTEEATLFPQQINMAATWNTDLVRKSAEIIAYETRASSIPWLFAPTMEMGRSALWPGLWETYGEDVYLASQMGKAAVNGFEGVNNEISHSNKVASCIKHFVGEGAKKSGKDGTPSYLSEIELREYYLPSYKAAIDAGAHAVMVNSGIINSAFVHSSLLTELLRDELGFKGVAVTDWTAIKNLYHRDRVAVNHKEAIKKAINAGVDMSIVPSDFAFTKYLIELVNEGEVSMIRINEAVKRILKLKLYLGLFDKPVSDADHYTDFGSEKHKEIAYQATLESITLLKNEQKLLPLKKGTKILVTGPNANLMCTLNGGKNSNGQNSKTALLTYGYNTILKAVQNRFGKENVYYEAGVEYKQGGRFDEETNIDIQAAVENAKKADVILLCLGENTYTQSSGNLHDLYISQNQRALAEAMASTDKPVILALNEGRPRLISQFQTQMTAILQTYLPGHFGGDALASILIGENNPSGKLPYSYPMYPNALGTYDHKLSQAQENMQRIYGYNSVLPLQYSFGYGLSYTTFEYSSLLLSKKEIDPDENLMVQVKVKNTGPVAGKEVVQLYVKDLYASITPDNKRLRKFEKVHLKPGESKVVNFKLKAEELAFIGSDLKKTIEKGEFKLMIADQSEVFKVTDMNKYQ